MVNMTQTGDESRPTTDAGEKQPVGKADLEADNAVETTANGGDDEEPEEQHEPISLKVVLPGPPKQLVIQVTVKETLNDVRACLIETPSTSIYTVFHFEHDGRRLDEYAELGELDIGVAPPAAEVTLVRDPYTERDARLHVSRLLDFLSGNNGREPGGETLFDTLQERDGAMDRVDDPLTLDRPRRRHSPVGVAKCVKRISLSGWNPPTAQRRLKGDLLYLEVETNEKEVLQVAATTAGFVLTKSTDQKFDPPAKAQAVHALAQLLGGASAAFKRNYAKLTDYMTKRDPLLTTPLVNARPARLWYEAPGDAALDPIEVQRPYLEAGSDGSDSLRDWNEEIQNAREMAVTPLTERVLRSRVLQKTLFDFAETSVKGAQLVVRGELTPLNPAEPADATMYIHGNVFFSKGLDGVGTFAKEGGDAAAHKAVSLDVNGVRLLTALDVDGLATLGTCIVDYAGRRVVAQSIVPGIFSPRKEGESQIIYGGIDGPDAVATDEKCDALLKKVSSALKLRRHAVFEKDGTRKELELGIDTKGLAGADGRTYLLDTYSLTPIDVRFLEGECVEEGGVGGDGDRYPHRMVRFRHEFVEAYWESRLQEYVRERMDDKEGGEQRIDVSGFDLTFNPDTFLARVPDDESEADRTARTADEATVRAMSEHLWDKAIPKFVEDVRTGNVPCPMDGDALVKLLHRRGINVRCVGAVLREANKPENEVKCAALRKVALGTVVSRTCKHLVRGLARDRSIEEMPALYADLLNAVMRGESSFFTFDMLRDEAARRFRCALQREDITPGIPLLRELCLQLGIQLGAREQVPTSFTEDDVVDILPRVKSATPKSGIAEEALEAGRLSIYEGKMELGVELIRESIALHEQIYGSLHPETARGYNAVAMVWYSVDQPERAIEYARRAVVCAERTIGLDSGETILFYLNLALFEHAHGQTALALVHIEHALRQWRLIFGNDHPDTITTLNNAALMLQSLKRYDASLKWFERTLSICTSLYGAQSLNAATLYFQLSQSLAVTGDHKAAVGRMRDSYQIFLREKGAEDANTKETAHWLSQLTQQAVAIGRRQLKNGGPASRRGNMATPVTAAAAAPVKDDLISSRGNQSVDELVAYINGSQKSKKAKRRAK